MRPRSRPHRIGAAVLCALVVAAATVGCGNDDPSSPDPPTTTSPASATTLSPEQEDEQALRQLAEDWFEVVRQIFIDGEDPAVAEEYLTGEYLDLFRQQVEDYVQDERRTERDPQGRTRTSVESVVVEDTNGVILECVVNADILIDASTDSVIDDSVGIRQYSTTAELTENGWRLTQRTTLSENEGGEPCAISQ